jgi:hypothetical protein
MRPLLVKSSLIIAVVLAMTSGVTLASASSKPGMFLYPVKQMSQKATGIFSSVTSGEIPTEQGGPYCQDTKVASHCLAGCGSCLFRGALRWLARCQCSYRCPPGRTSDLTIIATR